MKNRDIRTLKQFYSLMNETRDIRVNIVNDIFSGRAIHPEAIALLKNALSGLEDIPEKKGRAVLLLDNDKTIETELTYETGELKKDIYYLENGEEKFLGYLENLHPGFPEAVESVTRKLKGIQFNNFITDRDGTINNYCGRYRSSVQSVWNSVFLTRFAGNRASNSVIITSAPLSNPGILDVSVNPEKTFIYAASKAREYVDLNGTRHTYPISKAQQDKINELNRELTLLVARPEYEKYSLIGSGFQLKFGQTTIARQDISGSIPVDESRAFQGLIENIVHKIDPEKKFFRTEDTGYDIEIILTVENSADSSSKDFDKGDGISFLDSELNLRLGRGPNLISGDTSSDLCMIEHSMSATADTLVLFVAKDKSLEKKIIDICPDSHLVKEPDILVAILNNLSMKG